METYNENKGREIEVLERKISDFQKIIAIKREFLKEEAENENEATVELIQSEIAMLKEQILHAQVKLRKTYLKFANQKLEQRKAEGKTTIGHPQQINIAKHR
jgi:hypothetical protein